MTNQNERTEGDEKSGNLLVATARAIGKAAGTVASAVVHHETAANSASDLLTAVQARKPGKLPKRNKHRSPRRQKKALGKSQVQAQAS